MIAPPPQRNLALIPLLEKVKSLYLLWYNCYRILPKEHRYTLGIKIDNLLTEIIEAVSCASFLVREEKLPFIKIATRKTDTIKIFLLILWETKSLDDKKYLALSDRINEVGRMLGGWRGQLAKMKTLP